MNSGVPNTERPSVVAKPRSPILMLLPWMKMLSHLRSRWMTTGFGLRLPAVPVEDADTEAADPDAVPPGVLPAGTGVDAPPPSTSCAPLAAASASMGVCR